MLNLIQKYRHLRINLRWRKCRKRKKTLRLRVGNIASFLHELNTRNIPYVVLRWFDEVPLTEADEASCTEDIDFLIDHTRLKEIAEITSRHPGEIKCDFYSPLGKRATGYKNMPYYPPIMANEVLDTRTLYKNAFYIPSPDLHFKSLAYHLIYHKALTSGIPSGVDSFPDPPSAKRPYRELLEQLGDSLGTPVPKPYTLIALHHHLQKTSWSMPYDLMVRWPKEKEWMRHLAASEEKTFTTYANKLPDLIVFLLRADVTAEKTIEDATVEHISKHFKILKSVKPDDVATQRIMRNVRGGNWIEHRNPVFVPPTLAIICHDESPLGFEENDPRRKKYPLITNAKVLYKNDIRSTINLKYPQERHDRIVLHASDNRLEAQHHLQAVYGDQYPEICKTLLADITS